MLACSEAHFAPWFAISMVEARKYFSLNIKLDFMLNGQGYIISSTTL